MPSKNTTTVVLNKTVQKIKDELAPVFGLKNILSAGLLLFSRLSDSEQKKTIAEVHQIEADEIVSGAEADVAGQKRKRVRRPAKAG